MSKTLAHLAQKFQYLNIPTGAIGDKLHYVEEERSEVEKMIIDDEYQRLTSKSNLKKQGILNWTLLLPLIVAVRPDSLPESERGKRVIDGQHKGIKYLQSQSNEPCPVLYLYHPEDFTLDDCKKSEAQVFSALNTLRKKLSKLEEVRAGVVWNQPEAVWVQTVLLALNLCVDGSFGSTEDDARELKGFYQFWFLCDDNKNEEERLPVILSGYRLWKKVFPNATEVNGTALRAMVLVYEFLETLTNGRKEKFYKFLTEVLPLVISQDKLVKPFTDRKSNRYLLYSILDKYAEYADAQGFAAAYRIGKETIADAVKIHTKFSDPRV